MIEAVAGIVVAWVVFMLWDILRTLQTILARVVDIADKLGALDE